MRATETLVAAWASKGWASASRGAEAYFCFRSRSAQSLPQPAWPQRLQTESPVAHARI